MIFFNIVEIFQLTSFISKYTLQSKFIQIEGSAFEAIHTKTKLNLDCNFLHWILKLNIFGSNASLVPVTLAVTQLRL